MRDICLSPEGLNQLLYLVDINISKVWFNYESALTIVCSSRWSFCMQRVVQIKFGSLEYDIFP